MNTGLLIVRLVVGVLMAAHGSQKLFGWFGGYGLAATAGFFENLGFRPGRLFAALAATAELFAGLLLVLGLLGPIGPALMLSVMIVAAGSVHWPQGVFAANNGIELPLLYGAFGVALALTGPGSYSVDALVGISSGWTPALNGAVAAVGALGGVANLAIRRPVRAAASV